jgi:uncharacterized membrane protein YdjX (TVP38/TMEM64 family)
MQWTSTTVLRLLAIVVLVAAAVVTVLVVPHDPAALARAADAAGPWAALMFVAAWALGTSLLVSSTLLALLGGLLFGPVGVVLSLVGSPLGALAAFAISRFLGGEALVGRLPRRVADLAGTLERSGVRGIAMVRLMPGVPAGAFNYACGLTRVRARDFFLGSALGAAPRVVLYGLTGGAMARLGLWAPVAVSVLMGAVALAIVARRRIRLRGGVDPRVGGSLAGHGHRVQAFERLAQQA